MGWADGISNKNKEQFPSGVYNKIKWVYGYKDKIDLWKQWTLIGQITREEVRCRGFGEEAEERLSNRLVSIRMADTSQQLACTLLDYVSFESKKLLMVKDL